MPDAARSRLLVTLAGALLLLWPAVFNGYPLLYSDTGTYLWAGFEWGVPRDRSLVYGLVIRAASAGVSLWGVAAIQALLVVHLVVETARCLSPDARARRRLAVVCGVGLLTAAPWYASLVLMDIFAPILLMAMALVVASDGSRTRGVVLGLVVALSVATHTSHPVLAFAVLGTTALLVWWRRAHLPSADGWLRRLAALALVVAATTAGMMTVNRVAFGRFTLNPSQHMFLMARLSETSLLRDYLSSRCPDAGRTLCEALPALPYESSDDFLWSPNGVGSRVDWLQVQPEYSRVLAEIFTRPSTLAAFVADGLQRGVRQLTTLRLTAFDAEDEASSATEAVDRYFPHESRAYRAARQYASALGVRVWLERVYLLVLVASVLWLGRLAVAGFSPAQVLVVTVLVSGVIVNAWLLATLSAVNGRYQSRVAWLVVLLALAVPASGTPSRQPESPR